MDNHPTMQTAWASGRRFLTEVEAKAILRQYGVPVVNETVVSTPDEAIAAAKRLGFPVVLKGIGENLLHKTESGVVHIGLNDDASVFQAANQILATAADIQILVQPLIRGKREWVVGLFRDAHFGPAILFGLGGIFTEALSDIVFRLAPLTREDAIEMIDAIRSRCLLGAFRGEAAVDREALLKTIMGLSAIATDIPEIAEVDINPLIAGPDGSLTAVDALITLADPARTPTHPLPISPPALHALFHPRSVAFVGASSQVGKWGHMLICNAISGGYQGEVHAVNPKGDRIAGRSAYKTITDIPGPVDLAVVTVPAAGIPDLIPLMKVKGIKNMLLVTSGFGETGADGKRLEKELADECRKADILLLGPNTMGICNPHIRFYCMGAAVCPIPGSTAVVAQSGNMGTQLLAYAAEQGIGIRAFSGSGNEAMITIEDYMEGFEVDSLTGTVMLYIESVKNGRRFFESARRVSRKKPIVLLKGGQTQAGSRAAASHTGAMASDARLFDAVCQQAGIIKVDQPMELLDLAAAFSSLPIPQGNRVAIMTLGGGWGVVTADLCNQLGLDVPELSANLVRQMDKILPPYWSRSNPVDIVGENDTKIPLLVLEALLAWEGCDAVISLGILGRRIFIKHLAASIGDADPGYSSDQLHEVVKSYEEYEKHYIEQTVRLMERYHKPVFGVSLLTDEKDATVYPVPGSAFKGIFYETPEQAVKAAARMAEYQRWRTRVSR